MHVQCAQKHTKGGGGGREREREGLTATPSTVLVKYKDKKLPMNCMTLVEVI